VPPSIGIALIADRMLACLTNKPPTASFLPAFHDGTQESGDG